MRIEREKTGEAVFHDLRTSVYEIYQESVQRVRAGAAFQAYRIIYENEYYPYALNEILWSSNASEELAKELPPAIAEESDGLLNCVLILNGSPNEGILLHQSGKKLICAYYPPITHDFINRYRKAYAPCYLVLSTSGHLIFLRKAEENETDNHSYFKSEGRRRKNNHLCQPGNWIGSGGKEGAASGLRSPGQLDD